MSNPFGCPGLRWSGALFGGLALGAVVALGQTSPQEQRSTFRTEANYVRVDVYATTGDGTPLDDLRREDFRLLEDGAPQTIDQFTHVAIRSGGPPATRSDPRSPDEGRQAVTDARARVFVLFLDVMHVDVNESRLIARPLIGALRRLLGPDDLIALVTPQMSLDSITFTRQLANLESTLERAWGARDRTDVLDPVERRYAVCYPGLPGPGQTVAPDLGIAQDMILRRREEQTFNALERLMAYLRDAREERKAVIAITAGWRVYRRSEVLARPIDSTVPTTPRAGFDPRTGQLSNDPAVVADRRSVCDGDRLRLASLDHEQRFRQILDMANRANVSFYPVDPRGIAVFDDDIVPVAGVGQNPAISLVEDNRRRGERLRSLRTMAEATDGVAVVGTGSFEPALRRMTDDLSAYYLLGYYSTGKIDGKFHAIKVSVTRPGVQIRARRGYLAARAPSAPPVLASELNAAAAERQAVTAALGALATIGREPALYVQAAVARPSSGVPSISAVIEIGRAQRSDWTNGGQADVLLVDTAGNAAGSGRATVAAGAASARVTIAPPALAPGMYDLQVRAKGSTAPSASIESTRVTVPASDDGGGTLYFRRGPSTGNREVPTADLRFRRNETLRLAVPAAASTAAGSARLLDRTGAALAVPVMVSAVDESDGSRWLTAQATLAPLAPGDYVMEVTGRAEGASSRTVAAFRVVP